MYIAACCKIILYSASAFVAPLTSYLWKFRIVSKILDAIFHRDEHVCFRLRISEKFACVRFLRVFETDRWKPLPETFAMSVL